MNTPESLAHKIDQLCKSCECKEQVCGIHLNVEMIEHFEKACMITVDYLDNKKKTIHTRVLTFPIKEITTLNKINQEIMIAEFQSEIAMVLTTWGYQLY